jgi:hypothetical protein
VNGKKTLYITDKFSPAMLARDMTISFTELGHKAAIDEVQDLLQSGYTVVSSTRRDELRETVSKLLGVPLTGYETMIVKNGQWRKNEEYTAILFVQENQELEIWVMFPE